MTDLRSTFERYVNMRQGLGYKFQRQAQRLADFVSFMEKHKAVTITTKLAVKWATLPPDRNASWALRLTAVRGFARHVANLNPKTEVPPPGILPPLKRAKPYIYSDEEIIALLAVAMALPPADGLRRWTYHCLFGLLAVTGMRLSEAIGLQRNDVDLEAGVLTIGASSASPALCHYMRRRARCSAATQFGAMLILGRGAARTSSLPRAVVVCVNPPFIASLCSCPAASVFGTMAIAPGRASTTSGIGLPSGRWLAGIARGRTWRRSFRRYQPISATPWCGTPIGISRPVRS